MTFLTLHARLIWMVQVRIRNGDITERGFARLTGISQPHIHHVLKGARALSPGMSDRILEGLGLTVLDLVDGPAWGAALSAPLPKRPPRGKSRAPLPRSAAS
jgi:hypothetical protein